MAAKGNTYATGLLSLVFNNTAYALIGSPVAAGNLWVSLHTASPGAGGNQGTNEATYSSYARVGVTRTSAGWTVASGSAVPAATIVFPAATGGSETESFFAVGASATGNGPLYYFGAVSPVLSIVSGTTPELAVGTNISES